MKVGVVAIQGDFEKHIRAFGDIGVEASEIRLPEELDRVERLVIPGGESTTVGLLMQRFGLGAAIKTRAEAGMPVWGTCMGMIMMAGSVQGRAGQYTLDLLDVEVERNAFGAQVHSFEDLVEIEGIGEAVMGVFIRAPVVVKLGPSVSALGSYRDRVVAVRQGARLGTSFHPELTDDRRLHRYFVEMG